MNLTPADRFQGCLLGLAVGDAVGTTVEFQPRGSFERLTDVVGGGPFGLEPGEWTDDTSMALCLAHSLLECDGVDPPDQMERYVRWWRSGYCSPNGRGCFDIGNTVRAALAQFESTGKPLAGSTDPYSAGNGSIMRLAPVPMFFYPDREVARAAAAKSSRTTHGAEECIDACRLLCEILCRALGGGSRSEILAPAALSPPLAPKIDAIARGEYLDRSRDQIRGTGYVVESLEAALWCFARSDSFEEAVLLAANLGDDADTTAAVSGQVAGAFWGVSGIPDPWIDRLAHRDEIAALAERLFQRKPQVCSEESKASTRNGKSAR